MKPVPSSVFYLLFSALFLLCYNGFPKTLIKVQHTPDKNRSRRVLLRPTALVSTTTNLHYFTGKLRGAHFNASLYFFLQFFPCISRKKGSKLKSGPGQQKAGSDVIQWHSETLNRKEGKMRLNFCLVHREMSLYILYSTYMHKVFSCRCGILQ